MGAYQAALEARARILRAVRGYFEGEGFLEVETPARVRSPGQEVHLDAVPAGFASGTSTREARWLITSPEYHMKRLCAAGLERIFQVGKCWRAGESGPHHLGEFTMVEWYRADAPLTTLAEDCEALVRVAARAAERDPAELGADRPFARVTVRDLLARHGGIALDGREDAAELRRRALAVGVALGSATAWDDIFYQVFLDRIEPILARSGPTFVYDWPEPLGALARPHPAAPGFVERFELYAGGLELANAFGELIDPVEQRRRFESEARERGARGKDVYPIDDGLLAALPRMRPTVGIALGFDRLVMLALGARDIREVVAFCDDFASGELELRSSEPIAGGSEPHGGSEHN